MPDYEADMTDAELDRPATRRDIVALRDNLEHHFDAKLAATRDELKRHFDVVAESFKADFANLFDWTQSTTSTMGKRIDGLESSVTRLQRDRKK